MEIKSQPAVGGRCNGLSGCGIAVNELVQGGWAEVGGWAMFLHGRYVLMKRRARRTRRHLTFPAIPPAVSPEPSPDWKELEVPHMGWDCGEVKKTGNFDWLFEREPPGDPHCSSHQSQKSVNEH